MHMPWRRKNTRSYGVNEPKINPLKKLEQLVHIAVFKAKLWKEVKYNMIRFLVYGVVNLALLMLGGLGFFYVEHCRDEKIPKNLSTGEGSFIQICNNLSKMLHNGTTIASNFINSLTNNSNTTVSLELKYFLDNIQSTCIQNKAEVLDERKCEITILEWFKWMEYTMTVAFTIGKFN